MLQPSPERDELGQRPPGSGLFPPYVKPGGEGSPVVYEMVRDAADDENEQRRLLPRGGGLAAKTQHGWNGLTLYRWLSGWVGQWVRFISRVPRRLKCVVYTRGPIPASHIIGAIHSH